MHSSAIGERSTRGGFTTREGTINKTVDLVQANGKKSINSLVIGEVVNVHIDDAVIIDGNIDMARIRPIARLGYMDYTSVDNIFTMHRVPVR